jgi:hypothetical protein
MGKVKDFRPATRRNRAAARRRASCSSMLLIMNFSPVAITRDNGAKRLSEKGFQRRTMRGNACAIDAVALHDNDLVAMDAG